ncbi:hypothetical protein FACS1894181_06140 [Bacteroidia bacterium]|nr:hypothetical protein FACS1894181_06140 [Bacteroidia bacterium]
MKTIFLIDGAAGVGKSDLMHYVETAHKYITHAVKKFTTRPQRDFEDAQKTDLEFISDEEFEKRMRNEEVFEYMYGDRKSGLYKYGFYKSALDNAIKEYQFIFIIIRNQGLIQELINRYKTKVLVIPVYIYSDKGMITERLHKEEFSEENIRFRMERSDLVTQDYIKNNIYKETLINNSNESDFHRLITQLLNKYSEENEMYDELIINPQLRFKLIQSLIGFKNNILNKLKTYNYDKNVFIMMKFRPSSNQDFYEYIKREVEGKGYNCVRADEDEWNITNDVYNPLAVLYCCKYGIALFDEPEEGANYNPNVAYELGIMHYQNKDCLIIKNKKLNNVPVPFDFIKNLYQEYSKEIDFHNILTRWLIRIEDKTDKEI